MNKFKIQHTCQWCKDQMVDIENFSMWCPNCGTIKTKVLGATEIRIASNEKKNNKTKKIKN